MSLLHACPPAAGRSRHARGLRRTLVTLSTALVLGASMAGCSSDEPAGDDVRAPVRSGSVDVLGATLHVRTTVSRVLGELSPAHRGRLEREAGQLLAGYLAAAYLHQRPAEGYRGAFPGFTHGARELALRDVDTVADGGFADAKTVRPRGAVAFLSVVAPEGRPVGATARVFLNLDVTTAQGRRRAVAVRGRLLLSPGPEQWRIFGYDLSLDSQPRGRRGR